jgi:hypothetical protein
MSIYRIEYNCVYLLLSGISRGKDMSNILGASDEEAPKKPVRKRKPRLTELDEDIDDDDDTDDYQLSELVLVLFISKLC